MNTWVDFLPIFLIVLFAFVFLILLPRQSIKHGRKLAQHFKGKINWPLGTISIAFQGVCFQITRIGRGGSYHGGGSYPELRTYVDSFPKFWFGSEDSGKYSLGSFLIMPPSKKIEIAGRTYLFACDDVRVLEKLENQKSNPAVVNMVQKLFLKDFHHIKVSPVFHWKDRFFKRVTVLTYTSLSEGIYTEPDLLTPILQTLNDFCRFFDLRQSDK